MKVRVLWAALSGVLATVLVAGCAPGQAAEMPGERTAATPKVTTQPANGKSDVNPVAPVRATVTNGTFTDVTLTNADGEPVQGTLAPDRKSWTASEPLGYGVAYTWSGNAKGTNGKAVPVQGSFTTLQPQSTPRATINPVDHATVGIAMPISIKFDEPVQDRAAVQRALKVHTSVPVEGSWAWLSDTQVDWRPKEYWPAHTEVSVEANLYGVHYGGGSYGKTDLTTKFSIGRAQVVKADVNSYRMVVEQDGRQVASYPASYGNPDDPNLNTPNGIYVAMQKNPVEIMDNPRYGYTDVEKTWAVRMSNHGEFIHENEENRANIGSANTTHGCINLTAADAKSYFDSALVGDPIEVTGSATTMEPRYDVLDWLLSWEQWQERSAL